MTSWFPSHRRARVITVFMAAIPVSGVFGNPLSGWIMDTFHETHGLSGWQWMFLLEAIPAVLVGIAVLFYLDNRPAEAKCSTPPSGRCWSATSPPRSAPRPTARTPFATVFRNGRVWFMSLIYFLFVAGQYGLAFWVPTIVKRPASRATSTSAS